VSTAWVIGASSPLGAALADWLEARGLGTTRHARSAGDGPGWLAADLGEEAGILALEAAVRAMPPGALVWSASAFPGEGQALDAAAAGQVFAVNALAPWRVGRAHQAALAAGGRGGVQVFLSDLASEEPYLKHPVYSLSLGARRNAIRMLARQAPPGVAVVTLRLGLVEIPGRVRADEARLARRDAIPGRPATLEEVQGALGAILDRPGAFHGVILPVDGGLGLRNPRA
jgi:NAD(P)-dependent dehydrogenase (short-subunit alcohol dehydrogenase family)